MYTWATIVTIPVTLLFSLFFLSFSARQVARHKSNVRAARRQRWFFFSFFLSLPPPPPPPFDISTQFSDLNSIPVPGPVHRSVHLGWATTRNPRWRPFFSSFFPFSPPPFRPSCAFRRGRPRVAEAGVRDIQKEQGRCYLARARLFSFPLLLSPFPFMFPFPEPQAKGLRSGARVLKRMFFFFFFFLPSSLFSFPPI